MRKSKVVFNGLRRHCRRHVGLIGEWHSTSWKCHGFWCRHLLRLFDVGSVHKAPIEEQLLDVFHGVALRADLGDLVARAVCGARVAHGVAVVAVGVHLQNDRAVLHCMRLRVRHSLHAQSHTASAQQQRSR